MLPDGGVNFAGKIYRVLIITIADIPTCVLGTVPSAFITYFSKQPMGDHHYEFHFATEETEARRGPAMIAAGPSGVTVSELRLGLQEVWAINSV